MYLAIDIGATKTLIALFSNHGHCLRRSKFLTNQNKDLFLFELKSNLQKFQTKKIRSIVIAVPAKVQKNYTFSPENLPWKNFDIISPLKNLFTCPIFVLNDADLATLYESGPFSDSLVYLTFSTGIGGGLAENGSLIQKSSSFEPGHKKYSLGEKTLEWEDFASAKALKDVFHKNLTQITKKSSLDTIAYRLSIGLADIINQYRPKTIIIGGPAGLIFRKIRPFLIKYLLDSPEITILPNILPAKRPEESVIYGCYLYAKFH